MVPHHRFGSRLAIRPRNLPSSSSRLCRGYDRAPRGAVNFCRFLTVARSPSCAAVKIRCRSRRTLSSWCRQSTASQREGRVLGSVHHRVSNLSFGSGAQGPHSLHRLTCPRQHPFEARAPGPVSGQLSSNDGLEEPVTRLCWFPVGFRPPAFASWTSCSRQRIPPSSRSAYRPATRAARTLSGFPCSARMRCDRVGCLLYPGAAVSSRPAQPLRSAPAASQRPALYPAETSHRRSC